MKIGDRLIIIETKLKYIEKLMYAIMVVILGTTGVQLI